MQDYVLPAARGLLLDVNGTSPPPSQLCQAPALTAPSSCASNQGLHGL